MPYKPATTRSYGKFVDCTHFSAPVKTRFNALLSEFFKFIKNYNFHKIKSNNY